MNRIRRICRSLAHLTGPADGVELRASQLAGRAAYRAGGSGLGFAGLFIRDIAAAASVAAGHPVARPDGGTQPATATATTRRRPMTAPRLRPHTVQLCVHCRRRPAGFWVSRKEDQTVRRPWCLSCCPGLDRARCDVTPFDP